jgi:hypothetical protein
MSKKYTKNILLENLVMSGKIQKIWNIYIYNLMAGGPLCQKNQPIVLKGCQKNHLIVLKSESEGSAASYLS